METWVNLGVVCHLRTERASFEKLRKVELKKKIKLKAYQK